MLGYLSFDIIFSSKLRSFPRATLSENSSLLGTDNVRGQISLHSFTPNGGYCLFTLLTYLPYLIYFINLKIESAQQSQSMRVGKLRSHQLGRTL